jgi:hypothetical protein
MAKRSLAPAQNTVSYSGDEQPEYSSGLTWSQPALAAPGYMSPQPANDNQRKADFSVLDAQRVKTKKAGDLLTKMSQSHTQITYGDDANHDLIWRNAQKQSSAYQAALDEFLEKWPL